MLESTTTIDLTEANSTPQEISIDEIHIETTEERLQIIFFVSNSYSSLFFIYFQNNQLKIQ